jgi:hypothetical protein
MKSRLNAHPFCYRWMEEYGEEIGALGGKIMGWYR